MMELIYFTLDWRVMKYFACADDSLCVLRDPAGKMLLGPFFFLLARSQPSSGQQQQQRTAQQFVILISFDCHHQGGNQNFEK